MNKELIIRIFIFFIGALLFLNLIDFENPITIPGDVEDNFFVLTAGIDKGVDNKDNYKITLIAEKFSGSSDTESSSSQGKTPDIVTAEGKTIFDAVRNCALFKSKSIFWGHMKYILISEDVAKDNILNSLDFFMRDHESRLDTSVAIVKNISAESFIRVGEEIEKFTPDLLDGVFHNLGKLSVSKEIKLSDLMIRFDDKYADAYIPTISLVSRPKDKINLTSDLDGNVIDRSSTETVSSESNENGNQSQNSSSNGNNTQSQNSSSNGNNTQSQNSSSNGNNTQSQNSSSNGNNTQSQNSSSNGNNTQSQNSSSNENNSKNNDSSEVNLYDESGPVAQGGKIVKENENQQQNSSSQGEDSSSSSSKSQGGSSSSGSKSQNESSSQGGSSAQGGEKEEVYLNLNGFAMFKDKKLIGYISDSTARGFNWANSSIESGILVLKDDIKKYIATEIAFETASIKINMKDDKPEATIDIKFNSHLGEVMSQTKEIFHQEEDEKLTNEQNEVAKKEAEDAIAFAQKNETDILDISCKIYHQYPSEWEKIKDNWKEIYKNMKITVNVQSDIKRTYHIRWPIDSGYGEE